MSIQSLKSFIFGTKAVPFIDVITETTREGINKGYIPKFLYKPPFGFPRMANIDYIRYLARTPYVEMCIDTILQEISSLEWTIGVNDDIPCTLSDKTFYDTEGNLKEQVEAEINHIKFFLKNPNTNKESFEDVFIKMAYRDVLEVNTGIVNKVYNLKKDLVELVARDGATFTKNPDIHGMYTNRAEILLPKRIVDNPQEVINSFYDIDFNTAREQGAYFQYGWVSGPVPIPFGKDEIIWMQKMIRTDDIYGYSPVQLLAKALQMLLYHIDSDLEYYNDNNVPKGIIGIDASDASEIRSFKEQWYNAFQDKDEFGNMKKKQHKVPILNYIPKFERIEFSSEEIQLIEKQRWYTKMVWACFGITPTELGYTDDAKGMSNQIVQSKVFRKKAVNPAIRMIEKHINMSIIPEFNYNISVPTGTSKVDIPKYCFRFKTFDIDEEKQKAELHKLWLDSGLKSINEIREKEGDSPVDWGDKPMSMGGMGDNPDEYDETTEFDDFDFGSDDEHKSFDLKHKYRSRKRVGGKWVYDYGDEGTATKESVDFETVDIKLNDESLRAFIKKNLDYLKNNNIMDMTKLKHFIISKKLSSKEFNDFKEISVEKSINIIKDNIKDYTLHSWFREENKEYKQKLVDEVLSNVETRNAGLNIAYDNYNKLVDDKLSFDDFLNSEIEVYRGGGGIIESEAFTSFTFNKNTAEKFGDVNKFKIKMKDTLGSFQTTAEAEVIVPKTLYNRVEIVDLKSFDLKHKYRSRKRVNGKWVYEYDEPKTQSTVPKTKEEVVSYLNGYTEFHNTLVSGLKSKFKGRNVYGRVKEKESAINKLKRKPDLYKNVTDIKDISGIRIESESIEDVYNDLEKVKSEYNIIQLKDYIKNPNNNYRSIHAIIEKDGRYSEVQIRTKNMTILADYMHDSIYKIPENIKDKVMANIDKINKYLEGYSDYFLKLDSGVDNISPPPCIDEVSTTIGCL